MFLSDVLCRYSYTLPTIAFSEYNDQTKMEDYRVTSDRLKTVSDVLSLFEGQTNFHNYTVKKQYFDRSSQRRIDFIKCSEPFIENDVEFSRITVKGESFMLHQVLNPELKHCCVTHFSKIYFYLIYFFRYVV